MRLGYFAHWFRPPYAYVDFLEKQGIRIEKIDYSYPRYLENFDVVLIEQNGFDDYIENDELYIRDWVKRGGVLLFMHQDYRRWAPCFLPDELGQTSLIHRHVSTIRACEEPGDEYRNYMMPWFEGVGKLLQESPNRIAPDEMIDWHVPTNTFDIIGPYQQKPETMRSAALSCYLLNPAWEVLATYLDPAVTGGALVARAVYGKGFYMVCQILFPEQEVPADDRCLAFWKKFSSNLFEWIDKARRGKLVVPPKAAQTLPVKKNYKLAIHMHSLDWYGCDCAPGTINALMRYLHFDICALAVKDAAPAHGALDPDRYSDDHVLFLDGQEYHPFNWHDSNAHLSHNGYHLLAMGIDHDAYTPEFTRSLFSDEEIAAYIKKAVDYVHEHGGAVCATHPNTDYWKDYDVDAADREPVTAQTVAEQLVPFWCAGGRKAVMNSVDLFGMRRMIDHPAVNFVYLKGETPCRDSVVKAIRAGRTIAGMWFDEADVTLNGALPGEELSRRAAEQGTLHVSAVISKGKGEIREIRVFSGAEKILTVPCSGSRVDQEIDLAGKKLRDFIRVEIAGEGAQTILVSTPFYLV